MEINFDQIFKELMGHAPFPWQQRIYGSFVQGVIPKVCDIPTGLGKTSVIPIWLIALSGKEQDVYLPRRLVYVVNRRTIVDQSTEIVNVISHKLQYAVNHEKDPLYPIANRLWEMSVIQNSGENLLAVSTLRGELADNLQWRFDPLTPGVIIGTVDMIGSKLLFSGYGDTRRTRPLNAGILGCDSLIVHDEAHLTPGFSNLLHSIQYFQKTFKTDTVAPFLKALELSATSRKMDDTRFQINEDDRRNSVVQSRMNAYKKLHLHKIDKKGKPLQEKLAELAFRHNENRSRVVVFVQSPQDAAKIHKLLIEKLQKTAEGTWKKENNVTSIPKKEKEALRAQSESSVSVLTGEIRGHERDILLDTPGMIPFTGKIDSSQAVYLVSTSAGEVGVDLHADHMVSDLTTLDSMIQRLGRVNRFGQTEAQVDVVYEEGLLKEKEGPRQKTLHLLEDKINEESFDVSPAALLHMMGNSDSSKAFSPAPEMVDATDILLDMWTQTSVNDLSARPEVAPWLHGIQENLPETWMAWRQETSLLASGDLSDEDIARWFQKCRITSTETLRMPTFRLWKETEAKRWAEENADKVAILLSPSGRVQKMRISELVKQSTPLNFATIIFPVHLGGLSPNGFFDGQMKKAVMDVHDAADHSLQRLVLQRFGDHYHFVPLAEWQGITIPEDMEERNVGDWHSWSSFRDASRTIETRYMKKIVFSLKFRQAAEWEDEDDLQECWLMLLKEKGTPEKKEVKTPTVAEHNLAVANIMNIMVKKLALPEEISEALLLAARHHDTGKDHQRWQTAAGFDANNASSFAKPSIGGINWRMLDGYRHELGSVLQALDTEAIRGHTESDLILHLIATHHGWARPHFEDNAFPPEADAATRTQVNLDIMMRYTRLQERFGYWQLAWLESLLRRADGMASAQQGASEEVSDE
ncbi:MAG: type I-U CRISPR-associated helicase/endonuclease Cas3 [Thermodesulfobacteriota bacterium]|nr:type I-U CRISPR-associated helicase/endonuclease Cas3 [Thermodesulfobacteriota bacterium]